MISDVDFFGRNPYVFYHLAKTHSVCHATEEKKPVVEPGVSFMEIVLLMMFSSEGVCHQNIRACPPPSWAHSSQVY